MRYIVFLLLLSFSVLGFSSPVVHEYQLNNGLKLLVIENHRAPVVLSSVWYKVGGSYEPDGLTGISHMLEHMMFKGTKRHSDGQFKSIIAQIGGEQNAATSDDFTMYYQLLPAKALDTSLALEADRMQNLAPQQDGFEKEHHVVMEERRMRIDDNPQSITWLRFTAAAFINNPYHHPVIGWLPDIQHYTLQDVISWYHTWYAPNNAEIIVIGDVNPSQVLQMTKKYFGKIPSATVPTPKPRTQIPSLGLREVTVNTPAELPWLVMGYNVPSLAQFSQQDHWQAYALYMAAAVLSEGNSSRFTQQLVRQQELVSEASAEYSLYSLHQTLWAMEATPATGHTLEEVKQALLASVKQLQTKPISQQELQRIKTQIIAAHVFSQDSLESQIDEIGYAEMAGASWQDTQKFESQIQAITPRQIQQVAQQFLTQNNLTVATLQPDGTPMQSQPAGNAAAGALS